jgi:hypothetical protein
MGQVALVPPGKEELAHLLLPHVGPLVGIAAGQPMLLEDAVHGAFGALIEPGHGGGAFLLPQLEGQLQLTLGDCWLSHRDPPCPILQATPLC